MSVYGNGSTSHIYLKNKSIKNEISYEYKQIQKLK